MKKAKEFIVILVVMLILDIIVWCGVAYQWTHAKELVAEMKAEYKSKLVNQNEKH